MLGAARASHAKIPMLRRLIRHPRTQAFLAGLLALYILAIYRTMRWTVVGDERLVEELTAPPRIGPDGVPHPRTLILAFWHENLPIMGYGWRLMHRRHPSLRDHKAHVLVSHHRDGRLIGDIVSRFDLAPVHGSSNKAGATGMRLMLRLLAAGDSIAITPDGPRGPRRKAAPGVAQLAALSGSAVMPCAAHSRWSIRLNSWDRMVLPLPFSAAVICAMPPIRVPRAEPLAALPAIEAAMNEASDRAARWWAG